MLFSKLPGLVDNISFAVYFCPNLYPQFVVSPLISFEINFSFLNHFKHLNPVGIWNKSRVLSSGSPAVWSWNEPASRTPWVTLFEQDILSCFHGNYNCLDNFIFFPFISLSQHSRNQGCGLTSWRKRHAAREVDLRSLWKEVSHYQLIKPVWQSLKHKALSQKQ